MTDGTLIDRPSHQDRPTMEPPKCFSGFHSLVSRRKAEGASRHIRGYPFQPCPVPSCHPDVPAYRPVVPVTFLDPSQLPRPCEGRLSFLCPGQLQLARGASRSATRSSIMWRKALSYALHIEFWRGGLAQGGPQARFSVPVPSGSCSGKVSTTMYQQSTRLSLSTSRVVAESLSGQALQGVPALLVPVIFLEKWFVISLESKVIRYRLTERFIVSPTIHPVERGLFFQEACLPFTHVHES